MVAEGLHHLGFCHRAGVAGVAVLETELQSRHARLAAAAVAAGLARNEPPATAAVAVELALSVSLATEAVKVVYLVGYGQHWVAMAAAEAALPWLQLAVL